MDRPGGSRMTPVRTYSDYDVSSMYSAHAHGDSTVTPPQRTTPTYVPPARPRSRSEHPHGQYAMPKRPWSISGNPPVKEFDKTPKVLDIIGCHREITVCGHVDLVRRLPIRLPSHLQLLEHFLRDPGNYEGRYSDYYGSPAKLLDYGGGYIALRIYDDVTRPEISEFLLVKGWKMIGFSTYRDGNKTFIIEKWCNIKDH